ncbi:hypothetical protein X798_06515 [Onchocerca flexuosa]|uniref:Uncharacterized protein n=1 Tax=Onchocerca flexuosa TaxID=387005 RepID=A0A238BMP3_9BILA|nr:hypothetical protein X798_06515 [Onchocerca flexuosa]
MAMVQRAEISNPINEAAIRAISSKSFMTIMNWMSHCKEILQDTLRRKKSRSIVEEEDEIDSIIPRTSVNLFSAQYSPQERKILTKIY